VIGDNVLAIGLPNALAAAPLDKKAYPGDQVAGIGPDAVGGPDADGRAFSEEPVELEVIAAVVTEDKRRAIDEFRTLSGINGTLGEVAGYAVRQNRKADDRYIGGVEVWHERPRAGQRGPHADWLWIESRDML
jgi:hypothetical protein